MSFVLSLAAACGLLCWIRRLRRENHRYKQSTNLVLPRFRKVVPKWSRRFACFVSHYQAEAGMDARCESPRSEL